MIIENTEIQEFIPHRYPMLLVDRILEIEPGKRIVGIKNITRNEPFFDGHFPGQPIMPGVLMIEAMAQVGAFLMLNNGDAKGKLGLFAGIDDVRFRKTVIPGDQLRLELEVIKLKGPIAKMQGKGFVDGKLVVEGILTLALSERPTKAQIDSTATVHPSADIGKDVQIGSYVTIGEGVRIGNGCTIDSHAVIEKWTEIGDNCHIFYGAIIGGQSQDKKHRGGKSFVKIGENNQIREFVTINRATDEGKATIIGNNNLLLTNVHIGHDCILGNDIVISNATAVAGHVQIDDQVTIAGMCGIHQFCRIGRLVMVGSISRVNQDIPPFMLCEGNPAIVHTCNAVGMERRGISEETRKAVKDAYKTIYRGKNNLQQSIDILSDKYSTIPEIAQLILFLKNPSEPGINLKKKVREPEPEDLE